MSQRAETNLGQNVRTLREARGLTQLQIAKVAGIPRATWSHIESGEANPTLQVLIKVAAALSTRLEELLAAPRTAAKLIRKEALPVRTRGTVSVQKLLPEPLPGLDIERMTLPAHTTMTGVPHTPGTREYLTVERGQIELRLAGETFRLGQGDVVMFRGDQRHSYLNPLAVEVIAYSVIAFAPSGL